MRLVFLFLLIPALVLAESSTDANIERRAQQVSESIISPYCPGRSLRDCPSQAASELKDEIRSLLSQGKSEAEVVEELVSRFGEKVRGVPGSTGFSLVAWAGPVLFIIGGGALLIAWLSRSRGALPNQGKVSSVSPEMQERIRKEME